MKEDIDLAFCKTAIQRYRNYNFKDIDFKYTNQVDFI